MKILITGAAGFIGFHLVQRFVQNESYQIIGLDSINSYYDISLKFDRLKESGISDSKVAPHTMLQSSKYSNYKFIQMDLTDKDLIFSLFKSEKFDIIINLAAQAGVRYALEEPYEYINSNILGFFNILEACRNNKIRHFVFASSSSVYGLTDKTPVTEDEDTDHPISLYAATKKSDELLAYTYSHLFNIPTTGLRFFTVYGPWGRPDMAPFKFTKKILAGEEIEIYGHGEMKRDFTYIDDTVKAIERLVELVPSEMPPYRILNIGRGNSIELMEFVKILGNKLNRKVNYKFLEMQPGDVKVTFSDTGKLEELINFKPQVDLSEGIEKFLEWYLNYYN